jgi:hypothetical protein
MRVTATMRREVTRRAKHRCEYCLIHQEDSASRHQIDHVISQKHSGQTTLDNLALCCLICNRRKSSDIGAIDSQTGQLARLFNPRRQAWSEHFQLEEEQIVGQTAEGRATVDLPKFNSAERLLERKELIRAKRYPPKHSATT